MMRCIVAVVGWALLSGCLLFSDPLDQPTSGDTEADGDGTDQDLHLDLEFPDQADGTDQDVDARESDLALDSVSSDPDVDDAPDAPVDAADTPEQDLPCLDSDGDGRGPGCGEVDHCLTDPNNWSEDGCADCADVDLDGYFAGCDRYRTMLGPDCNDARGDRQRDTYLDEDGDGYGAGDALCEHRGYTNGRVPLAGDCDESDSHRSPGRIEVPGDGVDNDCSGADAALADEAAVFVDVAQGRAEGAGTMADPVDDLGAGLALADEASPARPVLAAAGNYGAVEITGGAVLIGGYVNDEGHWTRDELADADSGSRIEHITMRPGDEPAALWAIDGWRVEAVDPFTLPPLVDISAGPRVRVAISHVQVVSPADGIAEDVREAIRVVTASGLDYVGNRVSFGAAAADSLNGLRTRTVGRVVVVDSQFTGTDGFHQIGLRVGEADDFDLSVVDSHFEFCHVRVFENQLSEDTHGHVRFARNVVDENAGNTAVELDFVEALVANNTLTSSRGRLLTARGPNLRVSGNVMATGDAHSVFDLSGGDVTVVNNAFYGTTGILRTGRFVVINNSLRGLFNLGNRVSPGFERALLINNAVRHIEASNGPCYLVEFADEDTPAVVMSHNNCDAIFPVALTVGDTTEERSFEQFDACAWPGCESLDGNTSFDVGTDGVSHILTDGSPLIDSGIDPSSVPGGEALDRDIDGDERPLDGDGLDGPAWDQGADEFVPAD